jgi:predicted enzyme related to lactoylglutathione lyase
MTVPARLSFTKILVDDLEAESAFYEAVLGLQPLTRFELTIDGSYMEEVILEADGSSLILVHWQDQPAPPRGEVVLGFRTPDAADLFARAEAAGGKIVRPLRRVEEAGGLLAGVFEDPEGHACEIVEAG